MAFLPSVCFDLWRYSGFRCSAPFCGQLLDVPGRSATIGEGAHIKGEQFGAARYDVDQPEEERNSSSNGIYLCASCHRKVDRHEKLYSATLLHEWKEAAHERAQEDFKPGRAQSVRATVDVYDERARAQAFLERHSPLMQTIAGLFYYHSERPTHIVDAPERFRDLRQAMAVAEPLMNRYGPDRRDYCFSPVCNAHQVELLRLLELVKDEISFFTSKPNEKLNLERRVGSSGSMEPITPEGSVLDMYLTQYREFDAYQSAANSWNVLPIKDVDGNAFGHIHRRS